MGAAAILLAASALLSRLMGLIRDKVISWQFGASHEADMYFAAFVVPDIINYLLAGAFVSITIIPLLARAFQRDEADAWRLFSAILFWMALAACTLTIGGIILSESLARIVAPGFAPEQSQRLAAFMRIILPAQIFFLTGSCFTALLFLRRQFAAPALSPLIYNGCIIAFGLCLPLIPGIPQDFGMTGYCIGVTCGAFLGAFILPLVVACRDHIHIFAVWRHPGLKRFFIIALPLMLGQTVVVLDEQFLRIFGSLLEEGNVSLLNYGRRIAQVPVSLMGQAIAVASYPFLVKLLAENQTEKFSQTLNAALRGSLLLVIPFTCWMISASRPILGIIFEGGRFGPAQTQACIPLTMLLLAAAPVWIFYMVLARAFYAYEDTITPALTGTIVTIFVIPCYYWLAVPSGAWALTVLSGLSLLAYVAWLGLIWIRRHGTGALQNLSGTCMRILACSLLPAAVAWLLSSRYAPVIFQSRPLLEHCYRLTLNIAVFAALFFPLAWLLEPSLLAILKRRFKRSKNPSK